MTEKQDNKDIERENRPRSLMQSFLAVFTLPFRVIKFAVVKFYSIPMRDIAIMSAIFWILVAVTFVIVIKATSQPAFCVSCHYMIPYFESWEISTHKDVHCTECHFPPGIEGTVKGKFTALSMLVNYFTGVYKKSKPWAEISDLSCLREGCHETRLLEGIVPFKEGIKFNHEPHLLKDRRGKHLRCTSCHSQIVQGSHMKVTEETCFLCHFKDQPEGAHMTDCKLCHLPPTAADSANVIFDHTHQLENNIDCTLCHGQMVTGDGDVPKDRCSYCHAEIGKLERYSETIELHEIHISEHKVDCNHCHNTMQHKSIARTGSIKPECKSCHVDRHLDQYSLFSGQGAIGVDPLPSQMFHNGLGCKACHIILPDDWEENPGQAIAHAGPASCNPCHKEDYYTLYMQAKPVLDKQVKETAREIKYFKQNTSGARADSILSVCEHNLKILSVGHPIHNLEYADRIIHEIDRSLSILQNKKPEPRSLPDTTSARCLKCHFGQDEVFVQHNNKLFSHRNHVHNAKLSCKECHIEEKPNHGDLKEGSFCMECHHKPAAVSCEPCHSAQRNLIRAEGVFADYSPDIMYEAELTCRDCHLVEGIKVHRPGKENCESCHEPGYWKNLQKSQNEFQQEMTRLEAKLNGAPDSANRRKAENLLNGLKRDGTRSAHNPLAVMDIVSEIDSLLK